MRLQHYKYHCLPLQPLPLHTSSHACQHSHKQSFTSNLTSVLTSYSTIKNTLNISYHQHQTQTTCYVWYSIYICYRKYQSQIFNVFKNPKCILQKIFTKKFDDNFMILLVISLQLIKEIFLTQTLNMYYCFMLSQLFFNIKPILW